MKVHSVFNSSFDDIDTICVAIGRPRSHLNQQHIGLLYINALSKVKFLHLAWHFDLKNDDPTNKYLWLDINLDPLNKAHLAAVCEMVYESNKEGIPYGICMDGSGFTKDGKYTADQIYAGLTCATFVIQVFHSQGFYIVDIPKWSHKQADKTWQLQIIQALRAYAPEEHIQYQLKKIQDGSARFKPEEVAVAASLPNQPHAPETLKEPASILLNVIKEHSDNVDSMTS